MRKPFLMAAGARIPGIGGGFWILSDFRELSFFGYCGPCFSCPFNIEFMKYALKKCVISIYPFTVFYDNSYQL